jgi:DNA-binding NarL/FixJ family response regulator
MTSSADTSEPCRQDGNEAFPASAVIPDPFPLGPQSPASFRLALVDDDESVRWAVREIVETQTEGWTLDLYASGSDALQHIPSAWPDVVLMDLWMPGLSGIECTRRLTTLCLDLRVLMFTGCSGQAEILESIAAGACGYLLKPVAPSTLVRAVRSAGQGWPTLCPEAEHALIGAWQAASANISSASLSRREREILPLLAKRLTDKEIALELGIRTTTVNEHLKRIFRKLGVRRRNEAVRKWLG